MKAYFIGLVIMGGCLLYGCHTKQKKEENSSDYSADSQSIARQDTLPLPTDTHAASSVSTEGWTAKQIRDSIELFFGKEYDTLPPHLRKIRRNMTSLWNTDDSVFLQLIIAEKRRMWRHFKTYVFNSPLIRIGGGPYDRPPEEALSDGHHPLLHASKPERLPNQHRTDRDRHHQPYRPGRDGRRRVISSSVSTGRHGKGSRNPPPSSLSAIRSFLTRQETISRPPCCLSSRKTLRDCTGCARPSSPDRAPASSIILWPPRSTYPITRKIMRNTHASPAGSTSLAPWPSSREEEKPWSGQHRYRALLLLQRRGEMRD